MEKKAKAEEKRVRRLKRKEEGVAGNSPEAASDQNTEGELDISDPEVTDSASEIA